jgi:hypothetical protein
MVLIADVCGVLVANAHHHPPEATITEARHFETGRVNDVVGLQYFVSKGTR